MKKNKPIDEHVKLYTSIVDAISFWLGYQVKIGREQLIHEASLRYPVADTITSKDISMGKVVLEELHPYFKSKKIDLVIFENEIKKSNGKRIIDKDNKIQQVYEFKLVKKETGIEYDDEHQRVFDDIVRLAYFNAISNAVCYFVICGSISDFKIHFVGQKNPIKENKVDAILNKDYFEFEEWNSNGLYKDWFGFNVGDEKRIEFKIEKTQNTKFGLQTFKDNYIPREEFKTRINLDSITLKTTCMSISPNTKGLLRTHAAGIWKIESIN